MPVTGADQLIYMTTRIETTSQGYRGSGTGFFLTYEIDGKSVPVIVTNKHVIAGAETGSFVVNVQDANGDPRPGHSVRVNVSDFERAWKPHPDPNVDLAICSFGVVDQHMVGMGQRPFYRAISTQMIARQTELNKLTAMEPIVMVGYPNGIWDEKNNRPIIRRGITATPPYDLFEGRPEFVIDCACFPGSSGSPVLIYDHMHTDKLGNTNVTNRVILLGILFAGPQWTASGEIVTQTIPTAVSKQIAQTPIMINLGYCARADQLLWFEQHIRNHMRP